MIYALSVNDRVISHPFGDDVIQNGIESDSIQVTFDSEWSDYSIFRAVFLNGLNSVSLTFKLADPAEIVIPWEVLQTPGRLFVTFIALADDGVTRIVTRIMERPFKVAPSGRIEGSDAQEATMDELTALLKLAEEVTAAAESATTAATDAAASATSAAESATSAASTASTAASTANTAATKANTATTNANTATTKANTAASAAESATTAATDAATSATSAAESATTAASNANTAADAANEAANSANSAIQEALDETVPTVVAEAVAEQLAQYSAIVFSVDETDGGLNASYSYEE